MSEEAKKIVDSDNCKVERPLTSDELRRTCVHEAGHAVVLLALQPSRFISAVVRKNLEIDQQGEAEDTGQVDYSRLIAGTPSELKIDIAFRYGGLVAEQELLGLVSAGQYDDLESVADTAHTMVCQDGMVRFSKVWPPTGFDKLRNLGIDLGTKINGAIRKAILATMKSGYELSLRTVRQRRAEIEILAEHLFNNTDVLIEAPDLPPALGAIRSEDGSTVIGLAERRRQRPRPRKAAKR